LNKMIRLIEYYKAYGASETFHAIGARLTGIKKATKVPAVLHIELNNTCNLNCQMCPRDHMTRRLCNMDFELYQKIIKEAASIGISYVRLFLFGEPLMYPHLIEAIQFAKSQGIKKVDFNTNANLLTGKISESIIHSGLDAIIFSVDGFSAETYEKIRIKGNYETCKNNILKFLYILEKSDIKIHTTIQTIDFPLVHDEIDDFSHFWYSRLDAVSVTALNPMQGLVGEIDYQNNKRVVCREPFEKMVILADGKVTTCCDDFDGVFDLGDANDQSLLEIWQGEKWRMVRRNFNRLNYKKYSLCEKCIMSYKGVC